jgi:hypothetical protein
MPSFLSLFDSFKTIDRNNSAVTIVFKRQHAGIIVESMHPSNDTIEIRYIHFLPTDIERSKNSFKETILFLEDISEDARPGYVDIRMYHSISYVDLIRFLELTAHSSTTYPLSETNTKRLLDHCYSQHYKTTFVPQFHIRGIAYNDGTARNCRSWVRDVMALVGIPINQSWWDKNSSDTLDSCSYATTKTNECIIM